MGQACSRCGKKGEQVVQPADTEAPGNPAAREPTRDPESATLLEKEAPPPPAASKPGCCKSCLQSKACKCCGCIFVVLLLLLGWVTFLVATAECAVQSFPVEEILPPKAGNSSNSSAGEKFDRGTSANMHLDPRFGIDLAGTWWMDGNPLTAEQLVSFAGASAEYKELDPFPMVMENPSNFARRWTWSTDIIGRGVVAYYSLTEAPETPQKFNFVNSSYADINPIAGVFGDGQFGFKAMNNTNEWDRVDTYILRRIVGADGTATEFWPKFLEWYKKTNGDSILVYSSDDACLRKCQYFLPCFACGWIC